MIELQREVKILIVGALTLGIFLLEIIAGYLTGSIALIADSFHMLSDVLALVIAFYAIRLAKQRVRKPQFTFGYQRAEILGAFANAVFLLALCFTIAIEAIQRFINPVGIENPKMVLIVGCVGLGVNLLGMFLFGGHVHHDHGDHGHDHHSHSHTHSHGGHGHSTKKDKKKKLEALASDPLVAAANPTIFSDDSSSNSSESVPMTEIISQQPVAYHSFAHARATIIAEADRMRQSTATSSTSKHQHEQHPHSHGDHGHHSHSHSHDHAETTVAVDEDDRHSHHSHHNHNHEHGHGGHSHGNMNMQGLFLHALGDALGSVGVIISSLVMMFADGDWKYCMDPLVSLLITGLIVSSAIPLVRSAAYILLQGVPSSVSMEKLRTEILALPGVLDIHELHVWGLSDNKTVASVHVRCLDPSSNPDQSYMQIAANVKRLLHGYGIHSTTVQPEFVKRRIYNGVDSAGPSHVTGSEAGDEDTDDGCLLKCEGGECNEQVCCPDENALVALENKDVPEVANNTAGSTPPVAWLISNKHDVSSGAVPTSPVETGGAWLKRVTPFKLGKKDSQLDVVDADRAESSNQSNLHEHSHGSSNHVSKVGDAHSHRHSSSHGHDHSDGHSHDHH
ncbi:zinc/cadmium resistance protein [Chytriomyces cf. hyalinus JEL632]|nr:zinc/cadmium resistance protein [Chytriomyces cf. hyalinus JEL632]